VTCFNDDETNIKLPHDNAAALLLLLQLLQLTTVRKIKKS